MSWLKNHKKIKEKKGGDTGLRGTPEGALYIDKTVFFAREEVKKLLKTMNESEAYPNKTLFKK